MKGTIQQVEPESLQLAPEKSRIHVSVKELAGAVDKAQVGQIVELTTRGGESLKGTLHEANQSIFTWTRPRAPFVSPGTRSSGSPGTREGWGPWPGWQSEPEAGSQSAPR